MQKSTLKITYSKTFGDAKEESANPWAKAGKKVEKAEKTEKFEKKSSPWPEKKKIPAKREEDDLPWLKTISSLATEKGREKEGMFLAEGVRVVAEIAEYHRDLVQGIYVDETFDDEDLRKKIKEAGLRIHALSPLQMKQVSAVVSGQGIFAACRLANEKPNYDTAHIITLVDAIQDPGNLGSIFRNAVGFGVDGIILGRGTVDPFNPKVVRGSSGCFLRMPFETGIDLQERFSLLRQKGFCIVATSPYAKKSITELSPRQSKKIAILIGNEGSGTNRQVSELADEWVKIQMENSLESLNVAVAHGVLCYQISQIRG
ncbi:MAG: RNA methyltransferase [Candidatus Fibromonas sp.]|jgi:TrmH family RNA methyltransferase|nr:RNA methyltransferase [Candidatus Fibromonas sp.]